MTSIKYISLAAFLMLFFPPMPSAAQTQQPVIHIVKKTEVQSHSAPSGAHLKYYGGPVISNVQIVVVYWGLNVSSTIRSGIPDFYRGVMNSIFFDSLSEYSTSFPSGTNQSIGRGSLANVITINPSISAGNISDSQIQAELIRQINGGALPQPKYDLAGNVETEYMIYFPPGVVITQGNMNSCAVGGFCAYHGTTLFNSKFLPYGVVPDFGSGSGCDSGCGSGSEFDQVTSTSSHELAESVTDIGAGQVQSYAYPLAWYDQTYGEIGDICNHQQAAVPTPLGTFVVQQEFSNAFNNCVSSGLHPNYQLIAPATVTRSVPFDVTLTVTNPIEGQGTNISFVGTVHFTSTDHAAVLPRDYTLTPSDQGVHHFTVSLPSGGTQRLTATDTVNNAITITNSITEASDFSISTHPAAVTIQAGTSGNATISTAVVLGSSQSISLSLSGLPTGASASFAPSSVTSGQSSILTINTGKALPGNYVIMATGTTAGKQHTASISVTVVDLARAGSLLTSDSADRLSWMYEPKAVDTNYVEFRICKVPTITWWKEFVVRSGNFILADFGVKKSTACTSQQVGVSSLQHDFTMELWKSKFLGIPVQVKVMPSNYFGALSPGSRVTVTWLKD